MLTLKRISRSEYYRLAATGYSRQLVRRMEGATWTYWLRAS